LRFPPGKKGAICDREEYNNHRFDDQDVCMAHNGKQIGFVASCAIDSKRFLTGQAK